MTEKLGRPRKGVIPLQTSPVKTLVAKWVSYCDVCYKDILVGTKFHYNVNDKMKKHRTCKWISPS